MAHVQVVQPADLPRFATLGVIANLEPLWARSDVVMEELTVPRIGPARAALQYPLASLLASGARVSFGSDWPVTSLRPLDGLAVAVTRQTEDGRPAGGWLAHERLTPEQALAAYTTGSAYQAFDDHRSGVIRPGMRADLVWLAADPVAVEPTLWPGLDVRGTWCDGRRSHPS
jgi:predicted amidohydrolase YtcJ